MPIQVLGSASTFAHCFPQSREPDHLKIFVASMENFIQLFMLPVWHMAFWKMTTNGDSAFRKLLIWPVVTNSATSSSPFCAIVHLLTHWPYGWNSMSTYVMTSDMPFTPKTLCSIPPKNKCLTMASTSLIVCCALEIDHFTTGQGCLCHITTGL